MSALADVEYQRSVWLGGHLPHTPYEYDFDMACQSLLDDTEVLTNPSGLIGTVLLNRHELDVLIHLAEELQQLIRAIGPEGSFEEAVQQSTWSSVVEAAAEASEVIGSPAGFP